MEELSPSQIEELRGALLSLREEVDLFLSQSADGAKPVDLGESIGRLTRMDAMQSQSMTQSNRRRLEIRKQQVLAALAAIEKDEYGICNRCEEPIGFPRLKVRPETPMCIECQETLESDR